LSIGIAVLCLPWLRWAQPELERPIRVNLIFPIVYLLATVFVTVVPMIASPIETGYGCLMILTSIPVYVIFIAWKKKPKWFTKGMGKMAFSASSFSKIHLLFI
jgi:solute carrier family 7 L-type amino acid transporter-like protein